MKKLADDVNNQFTSFQNQNKFDNTLDDGEVENLITDQNRAQTDWTQLQTANQNTFKDSVNENAFDESIANLNQSTDQFLDPSQSQGNKALDAYLLNQSGALNKARNDLIQQASQAKTQVKSFRDQSGSVVEGFENARKAELERVKNVLKEKMKGVDDVAEAAGVIESKRQLEEAKNIAKQRLEGERNAEIAKWQKALEGYNKLKSDNTAPVRMDPYIKDAQDKINQLKNQNLDELINLEGGHQGSFYTDATTQRFNKISNLLGLKDARNKTVLATMNDKSTGNFNRFGGPQEFKATPREDHNGGKTTADRIATEIENSPLLNPVATVKEAKKDSKEEKATTLASGGVNKIKKLFKR